ncbi:MAG: branched-chain amino acid ABC transporter permease, partial [Oscillospiraceae bacterium]|nr:branched-chain amino acid ABC transporter permease [Oscillospiraceae bacterium]
VITLLPEVLRGLDDYRLLIYAVVLIAMMLLNNNPKFNTFKENIKAKLRPGKKSAAENAAEKEAE